MEKKLENEMETIIYGLGFRAWGLIPSLTPLSVQSLPHVRGRLAHAGITAVHNLSEELLMPLGFRVARGI